jgi:hybrid cluster-associated redox disulfide protein
MKLDTKITINELMADHPSAIGVFIKRKLACIGCPAERFHTIEDAARMNGVVIRNLIKELEDVIEAEKKSRVKK